MNKPKKTAVVATAGALVAIGFLVLATLACSGMAGNVTNPPGRAQLTVKMHDDPGEDSQIAQANVTFSAMQAHSAGGGDVPVSGSFPMSVDLLTLVNGRTITLAAESIPPGSYDRLDVTISAVSLTLTNGTKVDITLPAGGRTAMIPTSFTVELGQPVTVTLDFRVDLSFKFDGAEFEFEPEIEIEGIEHGIEGDH